MVHVDDDRPAAVSRRGLVASAASAALAVPVMMAAPGVVKAAALGQDADLLALVGQMQHNEAARDALAERYDQGNATPAWVERRFSAHAATYVRLKIAIGATPARTAAGLRAKASAALLGLVLNIDGTFDPDRDELVAWSLCRDLLAARETV